LYKNNAQRGSGFRDPTKEVDRALSEWAFLSSYLNSSGFHLGQQYIQKQQMVFKGFTEDDDIVELNLHSC
jgi:hypothetical protein